MTSRTVLLNSQFIEEKASVMSQGYLPAGGMFLLYQCTWKLYDAD